MVRIRIKPIEIFEILQIPREKEEMVEIWLHLYEKGFLFNEFTLILEGFGFIYKIKIEGYKENQKIYIKEIMTKKDGILTKTTKTKTTFPEVLEKITEMLKSNAKAKTYEDIKNYKDASLLPPILFMQYAVKKAMNREYKEMPVTDKVYKPINERKTYKKKEEYKLFEVIRRYERHINNSRHKMTCERWDVKGHFRHYKNGKVVYVKPYEKGKGRKKERNYVI